MGKKTLSSCKEFVDNLLSHNVDFLDQLDMIAVICRYIGSDPRTVSNAIDAMLKTGLITETDKGFKLHKIA